MVYRIYVEKKPGFDGEAQSLRNELVSLLGIKELNGLRLLNRYDVEGIDEALFEQCVPTVFSEPPVAEAGRSCWGRGQQYASKAKRMLGTATRTMARR